MALVRRPENAESPPKIVSVRRPFFRSCVFLWSAPTWQSNLRVVKVLLVVWQGLLVVKWRSFDVFNAD